MKSASLPSDAQNGSRNPGATDRPPDDPFLSRESRTWDLSHSAAMGAGRCPLAARSRLGAHLLPGFMGGRGRTDDHEAAYPAWVRAIGPVNPPLVPAAPSGSPSCEALRWPLLMPPAPPGYSE